MATIGSMYFTMIFSNPTLARYSGGGTTGNFVPFTTTNGSLKQRSSRKVLETGEVIIGKTWESDCHFQPALLSLINDSTRVTIDGMSMMIVGYELIDQKKFYYRFNLVNGV